MAELRTVRLESPSVEQTQRWATIMGHNLRGGEVIELVSDLGGGKTTFTRGLVAGAGSHDVVASPTFTVSRVYTTPQFAIHHFDFYRLPEAGLAAYELHDIIGDPHTVIVVEWGGVVVHVLPHDRIKIELTRTGDTSRHVVISYPQSLGYVMEGIC